jgi:5-methylcytosine-specific restriction protein B
MEQLESAIERRAQAVLYGPPGTGKTWTAGRFGAWWLQQRPDGTGPSTAPVAQRLEWVTFHPSFSYEDFVEGFRPQQREDGTVQLGLEDGIFKAFCARARAQPDERFLLVIDEINRANIAKVLGELITLLEKDKRGVRKVTLPYSKATFTVPPNLAVLGTMNTADRSIRLLDTALRRRFGFVELLPDPQLFAGTSLLDVPLDELLIALNAKVGQIARDKQIGHSFFLQDEQPIASADAFAAIFRDEVLPLLQEYALDSFQMLAELVGDTIVDTDNLRFHAEVLAEPGTLLAALEAHLLGQGGGEEPE